MSVRRLQKSTVLGNRDGFLLQIHELRLRIDCGGSRTRFRLVTRESGHLRRYPPQGIIPKIAVAGA